MNLAIVESPLQALNAIEYLKSFGSNHRCRFVVFSNSAGTDENIKQIEFVLSHFGYIDKLVAGISGGFSGLLSSRGELRKITRILMGGELLTCIVGEYRSLAARALINRLKPSNVIVVDDGTATLRIERGTIERGGLKRVVAWCLGMDIQRPQAATFFSVYDMAGRLSPADSFALNDYSYLKQLMTSQKDSHREFIIGSPLQAAGVVAQDLPIALGLIRSAVKDRGVSKSDVIYIAHRRECQEKLNKISAFGVEVKRLPYPFELYSLLNGENAISISGLYSSLFTNLLNLNDSVSIISYQLDLLVVKPQHRDFVASVYNSYRRADDMRLQLRDLTGDE